MNSKMMYRQGDVLLVKVAAELHDLEPLPKEPRGLVLAEGETSGHYHALFGSGAKLMRYKADGRAVALVDDGGEVRVIGGGSGGVDRHLPVQLPPGRYEIRIQRSWTSEIANRQVTD